jgi:hypothetical protein
VQIQPENDILIFIKKQEYHRFSEDLHLEKYNTLGRNLKRGIFNFSQKISDGLHKPVRKFVAEMLYGLLAGQSCFLTKIARKLNERAALDKSVERLSRNLMNFDDAELLHEQYPEFNS